MYNIALFDLDETLITQKSLLAIAERFYTTYRTADEWSQILQNIKHHQALGYSRKHLNAYFFQHFKGIAVCDMQHCIKQWFTDMLSTNYFFNPTTMACLHAHQRNQDIVLIVSGSFYNAVKVITKHLGVSHIICNKLASKNKLYTGELDQGPIIGEGKVQAICRYLKAHNIIGTITHAYGDHPSDIPMLSLAQTPVAVGNHAELIAWAETRCWNRLDNTQTIDVI